MEDLQDKIIELMDLFDEGEVTTADKIDRPQRALDREAFDDFNRRFPKADGGMLVQPSADGSRPGYASDRKDVIEKAKKRAEAREKGLIYDTATKTFRKKEGVTYLTTSQKNKIEDAFPNVKLNFKLYPSTGVKKYLTGDQNKTNKTWAAIDRFKKKGYTLEDLRTGGSGTLPPLEKGKVSATELLEMINEAGGTNYTRGYLTDPRPGKKAFLQNIIADTLNRELKTRVRTTKNYRKTTGPATYYVFDKPTPAQLDFFVQYIDAPFLYDKTVKNVKILDKAIGKELAKSIKKDAVEYFTDDLTIDRVKQILIDNGVKNPTNYQAANAMTRYGQALQGKLFKNLDGITKNTKTGDFVFKAFNEIDRYHPWSQGAYTAILNDIDSRMGKQAGNLSQFKNAFKAKMKVLYPGRKFDFNEVFSLSTSANRGSYPYAYFVDLTSSAMNRGALSAYQGAASVAEGKIQTAIRNFRRTGNKKFYDEAVRVANVFNNQTRKNFLSSEKVLEYQKNYGIKPNALKIEVGSQRQVADKINIASNYFSDRNLQKWKNLGIDIDAHSGRAGYVKTFGGKGVPSNVITAGELFTEDTRLGKSKKVFDEDALKKFLKKNLALLGCPKGLQAASGGRVEFSEGSTCPMKGKLKLDKILTKGASNADDAILAKTILKAGGGLKSALSLKGLFGPAAIAATIGFEGGLIGYDMLTSGKTLREAFGDNLLNYALGKDYQIDPQEEMFTRFKGLGYNDQEIGSIKKALDAMNTLNTGISLARDVGEQQEALQKSRGQSEEFMMDEDQMMADTASQRAEQNLKNAQKKLMAFDQNLKSVDGPPGGSRTKEDVLNEYFSSGKYAEDLDLFSQAQKAAIVEQMQSGGPKFMGSVFPKFEEKRIRTISENLPFGGANPALFSPVQRAGGFTFGLAGGGIAKLAGVDQGPPPESGPNSQGLQGLMKRVKNI